MDNEPWQKRLKTLGISQAQFAELLGVAPNTVSMQLRGRWLSGDAPRYVKAAIIALEIMPEAMRADWMARVKAEG